MNLNIIKKERIKYIDVAKAIALFFVVLGHLADYNSPFFNWIFSFHMPLFFIISGMSIKIDKYNSIIGFIKRKIKTLLLPYFLFSLLGIIISFFVSNIGRKLTLKIIIIDLFYNTQPEIFHMGQLWFLFALFFASIYFYIIEKYVVKNKSNLFKICIYLILSIIGFNIIKYIYTPNVIKVPLHRLPFKLDSAITAAVFLKIGYTIQKYELIDKISKLTNFKYFILILLMLFLNILTGVYMNGYVNLCQCVYGSYINYYLSSIFGSMFIILFAYKIQNNKLLNYYGRNTLNMFAVHSLIIWLFAYIFKNGYIDISYFPKEVKYIITTIAICIILFPISVFYNLIIKNIKKYKIVKINDTEFK